PELTAYNAPTGMWSDNRFVCVDGSDYMADIYHGRFATPTDFYPNIEEKQLKWQFDPIMDTDFWNTVLCAGMLEVSGTVSNRWFLYTCETVHDTYEDIYGKTATRVYVTNATAQPPYYYNSNLPSNGEMVPPEITFDGTTTDIINSINDGVFIVQHRDHGSVSGWADPSFHTANLASLTNGMEAPIVFSFNCLTGQFYQNLCFAESFARMEGGATAVVAACDLSYSYFNDYMVYGCYMSFNDDFVSPPFSYTNPSGGYLAGQMMMNGKLEMQVSAPFNPYTSSGWEQYAEDEWDLFMVFGDPTMDMRTEVPVELNVIPPASLPSGSSEALFQVSTPDKGPVYGALVCLRSDADSLYATGLTDSTGTVTLVFDPIGTINQIPWMVTAHNTLPEDGIIYYVGIAEGSGATLFSAGTPFPNPGQSMIIPVTISGSGNFELTIYDLFGRAVETLHSGELIEGSHEFIWNGTCSGVPAPAGIYMVKYSASDGTGGIHKIVLIN
ncbi:MAG: T9SS type A sorting domain-containing protein, partial [Candidatus Aegiribacteria sp.]|nr:T9SS type A sorting domain-containing protein [Candidatus Aegiribacteria sp.]